MQIKIVAVEQVTKTNKNGKPYVTAEVTFKNLTFNKTETKVLMSFGAQKQAYDTLATAQNGEVYDIEVTKNEAGYNDWIKVSKGTEGQGSPTGTPVGTKATTVTTKSTYETPEERAKKQIYIVRQSSLSAAINTLAVGSKTALDPTSVIKVAQQYEDFVFGNDLPSEDSNAKGIVDMESDIPF